MNQLTEQKKESLLHAEYAIRHALIELSEINRNALASLGEHGVTLSTEIDRAVQSLDASSQLAIRLIVELGESK